MSTIHIQQAHQLGLKKARVVALKWAESAEEKLDMVCIYEEGDSFDRIHFKRSGASGTMVVRADEFEINVQLSMLLTAFKGQIESQILQTLRAKL